MKLFIISDIHGSSEYLKMALDLFVKENTDYIVVLGDILYHGARNNLPQGYNPKEVTKMLNEYSKIIMAVKGNCESEVDQMVLEFPINAVYSNMVIGTRRIFMTHGHIYNENNPVKLNNGDIFLNGHTHIYRAENIKGINYLNPGSITLPKNNNPHTYGILEEDTFTIKDLKGNILLKYVMED